MSPADHPTQGATVPRRTRILPLAVSCVALLAGFAFSPGHAVEMEPAVPTAETGELTPYNQRFRALLDELLPYDIAGLPEIAALPPAVSFDELVQRVDQVYLATATESAGRYRTYENNLRGLTDERVRFEEAKVAHAKLQQELAAAPARLKTEEARAAQLTEEAGAEERLAATLRENAAVLEEDFLAARGTALGSVYYLLPTNQRVAFHEGTQKNATNAAYLKLDEVESDPAARTVPVVLKHETSKADDTAAAQRPAPVAGSLQEKFAGFEDKQRALRSLATLLPPQEKQLAAARALADTQLQENAGVTAQLAEFSEPLAKSAALQGPAEDRSLTAQVNQKISAGNLLRLGTAALIWSQLKETIVAPQMENFLTENGLTKIPRGVALVDAINLRPQDFIPKAGAFENTRALTALKLKLLDVEANLDPRADATVEALGSGKISGSGDLLSHLFKNLDQPGIDVLRAAAETLEPPQKKLALALLASAPAQ